MSRAERMRAVVEAIARYRAAHGLSVDGPRRDGADRASSTSVVTYWLCAFERAGADRSLP